MGIRQYKKDHLRELSPTLAAVPLAVQHPESGDPLRFWTKHDQPTLVDLSIFVTGDTDTRTPSKRWSGGFSGRPKLIAELAPALKAMLEYFSPSTCFKYVIALRRWWRLLDEVENEMRKTGTNVMPVESVTQITKLHWQKAYDQNMTRGAFGIALSVINIVRKQKGLRRLHWQRPEQSSPVRHLPPEWQIREMRIHLKHQWFATLRRWQQADELLAGRRPVDNEEERLQRNYLLFEETVIRTGHPRPPAPELWGKWSASTFVNRGMKVQDMLRGRYPDSEDMRYAFHLCLATTGWNTSVFLSLDATRPFMEPHPKDPSRYLLRGFKARSSSEQMTEGLYKSQGSAGVILQTLLHRTEPLRSHLRKILSQETDRYQQLIADGESQGILDDQRKRVIKLNEGISSVWLYISSTSDEICWLSQNSSNSYARDTKQDAKFLDLVVQRINARQPANRQLTSMNASDFRDAFAAYAYRISGGMVLYVMKVLGHKTPKSTQVYLDNTLLNAQSIQLYRTFSNTLWAEIRVHKRLDPSIIAHSSRHGATTLEQRERLEEYRALRRSRIGVGCKNPSHPPARIAPDFRADGKAQCHVHRCMLCLEHAVVFPDSLQGLCKRFAELRVIKNQMSTVAFLESSFDEEMKNTEIVLLGFDPIEREKEVDEWMRRIDDGKHRVIDLDGLQRAVR